MNKDAIDKNPVVKMSFEFSLAIIRFCEELDAARKYVLSKQLLKSGTAIGANVIEAQNAESRADFIHKFKVAAKEAEETEYWLLLCDYSNSYPQSKELLEKIASLNRMIGKIISTSKTRNSSSKS
jgi:four helix bundle protein